MKYAIRAIVIQECDRVYIVEAEDADAAAAKVEESAGELTPFGETGCVTNVEIWDNTPYDELDEEDRQEVENAVNKKML